MEVLSLFTIADFLAYLFPGALSLGGIYVILLLTPIRNVIVLPTEFGIGSWLVLLILSYITGVIIATITDTFFRERPKSLRRRLNKGTIQLHDDDLKKAVMEAFHDTMLAQKNTASKKTKTNLPLEWNEYYYYVCRALVTEVMPRAAASGLREGAYRQLRMNLIGSIIIWGVAGVLWGAVLLVQTGATYVINGNNVVVAEEWSWVLIGISFLIPLFLISKLLVMMDKHERREVREILAAFLSGYKTGVFDKRQK